MTLLDPLTIGGTLQAAAQRWPEGEALVMDGRRLTWAGLWDEAVRHAQALVGLGIRPGQHVALLIPNSIDYAVLIHATALIGATVLTINARYRDDELRYVLAHSDADALIIGGHALAHHDYRTMLGRIYPELADWQQGTPLQLAAAPRLRLIVNLEDPRETRWPTRATLDATAATVETGEVMARAAAVRGDDIAIMMFSSGTTAYPKACMLPHACLARTAAALADRFRLTAADRIFDPLPFFHMSTMLPMAACRASGATFVGRLHFDAGEALAVMEEERITFSYASFPTMMSAIVAHPDFPRRDLSRIRLVHAVGPADLLRRYSAAFPQAFLANAYGLTEATGVPVYNELTDPQELAFSVSGRPFPGIGIQVVDVETLEPLPPGERGEIWLRGYAIFAGYYNDPEATARTLRPDGWLRTGDIGSLDPDGRIRYEGRLKDMLKIGGENVAAVEIESYLCTHPDILVAQVVGVPDDHYLEVAAAYVQLRDGSSLTPEEVVRYCLGKIATFKIPRYVRMVTEWPMSATKIQKFQLLKSFVPDGKIDPRAMR
ncbi:AMP-binding protein [uncultured Alsobacter sp.]|uniref:AMP-binding protein n=1 Tax=uncultured Alsobacter sp. TaxID=1748258 RepID=UPI0025D7AA32|nr:AMP-binding protein [uncultured Alsobacter sp.]